MERFAALPKYGRTRRFLARTPDELYSSRPDLARDHSAKLKSGWYLGTNVSRAAIERIIEMACDVANLRLGRDLIINLTITSGDSGSGMRNGIAVEFDLRWKGC